jgi:hypothetical protein
MYKAIKAYGHNVYIVASSKEQSGTGGTVSVPATANLTVDSQFGKKSFPCGVYYKAHLLLLPTIATRNVFTSAF